jgi:sec-independent protein translocase protein TatC
MPKLPKLLRKRTEPERTGTMTVVEHLEELRHRIVVSAIAITIGSVIAWFLYGPAIQLLLNPFCRYVDGLPKNKQPLAGCRLVSSGLLEPMVFKLKVVLFLGLFLALPVLLYQLWAFIVPGLTERERKMAVPFVISSMFLFALGATFAILTLPFGLKFLLGFAGSDVTPLISANSYIGFVMLMTLAFGLAFEFPIVLVFLTMVGVLSSRQLRSWRRWSILGIAVFAAVITPSSDPYTMLAMMIPMVLFYEASIIIARLMKK